jgi:hypothetical protein
MKNGRPCKSWDEISIRGRSCNTLGVKLANQSAFAFHKHKHHSSIHDFKHMLMAIIHPMVALYVILSVHIGNSSA